MSMVGQAVCAYFSAWPLVCTHGFTSLF